MPSGGSEALGLLPARCGCPHVGGRGWGSVMLMGAAQGWGGGGGALWGAPFDPSHSPISRMVFLFVLSCEVGGSCSVVPGGQSRGAAQEAGLCDQGGPRLPAPPGAAPRHQERGERRVGPCIAATVMLGSSERCSASWGAQRRLPVHPPPLQGAFGVLCGSRTFLPDLWQGFFCSALLCQRGSGALHGAVLKAGCFLCPDPRCWDVGQSLGAVRFGSALPPRV